MKDWEIARYKDAKLAYKALMKFYPFTLNDLEGEQWLPVKGYEELYQVSNFARIKRFYKNATPRIIKPMLHTTGRLFVNLWKGGKSKSQKLHRLVALAFIENPDNLPEINHVDTHPLNCHVSNLEWSTSSDNHKHAVSNGLMKTGEDVYNAKLTQEQAQLCRKLYVRGSRQFGQNGLATMMGVSQRAIWNVLHDISYC